jgi:hypothetical protein
MSPISLSRNCVEPIGPGRITPIWVWLLVAVFIIIINIERCCYSCDYDDLIGCPVCPNGYPCMYPCSRPC